MDFERKQVVVRLDKDSTIDSQKMIDALKEAGFGGSPVREDALPKASGGEGSASTDSGLPPPPGLNVRTAQNPEHRRDSAVIGFPSHVTVEAFLDRDAVRPGELFRVAVVVSVADGWHIYGNPLGPGIGQPTVITAEAPDGFALEPVRYAPAAKHEQDFGDSNTTWVWEYEGRTIHFLSGRLRENAKSDSARLLVRVKGQVCSPKSCLPGSVLTELIIPIVDLQTETHLAQKELFRGFEQAKPAAESSAVPAPGLDE